MLSLTKWGYKNEKHDNELKIHYRIGTTDEKVINEVLIKNAYQKRKIGFIIEPTDYWLDLGGNIGTFSLQVLSKGCKVVTFEPEPDNIELFKTNLSTNFPRGSYEIIPTCVSIYNGETNLYLCNGDYNKYRHSMCLGKSNRRSIKVPVLDIHDILKKYPDITCIKIDIEGEEINILEKINLEALKNIKKLVFEYSFDVDPSIPRFINIINRLKLVFSKVHYTGVKPSDLEYKFYPPCVNVFCLQ